MKRHLRLAGLALLWIALALCWAGMITVGALLALPSDRLHALAERHAPTPPPASVATVAEAQPSPAPTPERRWVRGHVRQGRWVEGYWRTARR